MTPTLAVPRRGAASLALPLELRSKNVPLHRAHAKLRRGAQLRSAQIGLGCEAEGECDEASCRTSVVAGDRVGAEHAARAGCVAGTAHHIRRALWRGRLHRLGWPIDRALRREDFG